MPIGHVKVFHERRNYGFVVAEDGDQLFLHGDELPEGASSGDEVEFDIDESDTGERRAVSVSVVKDAPPDNPVGRTLRQPPTWGQLQNISRRRGSSRRRRR